MSKRFTIVTVALCAAVAFLVGLIIAGGFTPSPIVATAPRAFAPTGLDATRAGAAAVLPTVVNFADVAERINAAVVNIDSTSKGSETRESQRFFRRGDAPLEGPTPRDLEPPRLGAGSGFIID